MKKATRKGKSKAGSSKRPRLEDEHMVTEEELPRITRPARWAKSAPLSSLPIEWQPEFYFEKLKKISDHKTLILAERTVNVKSFEALGLVDLFRNLGWMAVLEWDNNKKTDIYLEEIKEWMSTLEREDGDNPPMTMKLTGLVRGKKAVLTFDEISAIVDHDTGATNPPREYEYVSRDQMFGITPMNDLASVLNDLIEIPSNWAWGKEMYRKDLRPMPKMLMAIVNANIIPRVSDNSRIRPYELRILHAILTGRPTLSFRHIMMLNIWEAREDRSRCKIPYYRFLSRFLKKKTMTAASNAITVPFMRPFNAKSLSTEWNYTLTQDSCEMRDTVMRRGIRATRTRDPQTGERKWVREEFHYETQVQRQETQAKGDGGHPGHYRPEMYVHWDDFQKAMWDLQHEQFSYMRHRDEERRRKEEEQEEVRKAQIYMGEKYYNNIYQYVEHTRAYHDIRAGVPRSDVPPPRDYDAMASLNKLGLLNHPQLPQPDWWPQQPRVEQNGEGSSSSQTSNPFETSSLARGMWESIFNPPSDI